MRVNLHAKNVVDSSTCERCSGADEDRFHVFFGCVQSSRLWNRLNLQHVASLADDATWTFPPPPGLDTSLWPFVFLTILWRIWDCRNGHIFRDEPFYVRTVLSRVRDDLILWRKCLPPQLVNSLLGWHTFISDCIPYSFLGMKTDQIRTDITHIVFVFIFMSGFGFEYG
jgi:hypothetical protein